MPSDLVVPNISRRIYPNVRLTPGLAVDVAPGVGFDMNDALFPRAVPGPFQLAPNGALALDEAPPANDLVKSSALFSESTTYQREASRLAVGFSAKFGIVEASAAYARAKEELAQNTVFYLDVEVVGSGAAISPSAIAWNSPPPAEALPATAPPATRLRQFVDDHGSHYVERVYYGQQLTIRAAIASKSSAETSQFRAAVKVIGLFWGASINMSSGHEAILRSSSVDISATIIGGGVEPIGYSYISSWDGVKELLTQVRAGKVVIRSGPMAVDLKSYWHTLAAHPLSRAVVGTYQQPAPAEAPWGVPAGTIVAWRPREENLLRDPETGTVLEIVPPKGWALCTADGGGPNLDGLFLRGVSNLEEVDAVRGSATHQHLARGRTGYEVAGTTHGPEGADNYTGKPNWNHKHDFEIETSVTDHLPPHIGCIYIYKL